jgi:hypothetical protein
LASSLLCLRYWLASSLSVGHGTSKKRFSVNSRFFDATLGCILFLHFACRGRLYRGRVHFVQPGDIKSDDTEATVTYFFQMLAIYRLVDLVHKEARRVLGRCVGRRHRNDNDFRMAPLWRTINAPLMQYIARWLLRNGENTLFFARFLSTPLTREMMTWNSGNASYLQPTPAKCVDNMQFFFLVFLQRIRPIPWAGWTSPLSASSESERDALGFDRETSTSTWTRSRAACENISVLCANSCWAPSTALNKCCPVFRPGRSCQQRRIRLSLQNCTHLCGNCPLTTEGRKRPCWLL